MKILHIVPTYFPAYRYGGPIYSVHELNKWLVKNGAEVTVYTTTVGIDGSWFLTPDAPNTRPYGPRKSDVPNIESFNVSGHRTSQNWVSNVPNQSDLTKLVDGVEVHYFPTSFPRVWYYSRSLQSAIRQNLKNFDLVHITSVFLSASYWGAKYAKRAGIPYIISPRGSLIPELIEKKSALKKRLYINLVEKNNLAGASAIHFTTELEKEEYLKLGLLLKKAIVIPNGVEVEKESVNSNKELGGEFRRKFNIPKDVKIVLSLGRLNWKKGFDTLIPAFAEVVKHENIGTQEHKNNVVLVIAGGDEDEYKKEIETLITHYGLLITKNIIFTGDLRGNDKTAAYQSADIFVMPSYSENFGNSAIEAMAYGVPVIVTKGVGIAPDIEESKSGIVIEKNEKQLAKAILGLLRDDDLRKALGERGKKLAEEKYSWPNIAKKWMEEYSSMSSRA